MRRLVIAGEPAEMLGTEEPVERRRPFADRAGEFEQARRAREGCPELPIVAMSALPPEAAFLADGPLEYLEKPFTIEGIVAKLGR